MRKKILIVVGVLLVLVLVGGLLLWQTLQLQPDPQQRAVGASIPPLQLLNAAGDTTSLMAAAGSATPVLVVFRGHW